LKEIIRILEGPIIHFHAKFQALCFDGKVLNMSVGESGVFLDEEDGTIEVTSIGKSDRH
jgi:hypothetical protein